MSKTNLSNEVDDKKSEIIAAARAVFSRYGYKKTTMVDIAEEIGLNQASLYYYFNNKEEVFIESFLAEFNDFKEKVISIITKDSPIQQKIVNFYISKLEFFYENPIIQQIPKLPLIKLDKITKTQKRAIYDLREEERTLIRNLLGNATQTGELISTDIVRLTSIIIHLFQGIRFGTEFQYILSEKKPNLEDMKSEMEQSIQYIFENQKE